MKKSFIAKIQIENRVVINKKVYDSMKLKKGQIVEITIDDSPELR